MRDILLRWALPIIIGPVAFWLSERSQKLVAWIDKQKGAQGAVLKQAWTTVWGIALAAGIVAIPGLCPSGMCDVTQVDFEALVKWAVTGALATHGIVKAAGRAR